MTILKQISITICVAVLCGFGCSRSEMTQAKAEALLSKVGGVDEINKEAKTIFEIFGTNEVYFLQDHGRSALGYYPEIMTNHPDVKDFPAIFALGDFVDLLGGAPNQAALIKIKFGTRISGGVIVVFSPDLAMNTASNISNISSFLKDPSYIRVTNNIFIWKGRY